MARRRVKPDYDEKFTLYPLDGEEAVKRLLGVEDDGPPESEDEDS